VPPLEPCAKDESRREARRTQQLRPTPARAGYRRGNPVLDRRERRRIILDTGKIEQRNDSRVSVSHPNAIDKHANDALSSVLE
jgi:hypothetical protein